MDRFGKVSVEDVSASMCDNLSLNSKSAEGQVANQIEKFVSRAFVVKALSVIDGTTWTEDDQVAIGNVRGDALRLESAGFALRHERASGRDNVCKRISLEFVRECGRRDRTVWPVIELVLNG